VRLLDRPELLNSGGNIVHISGLAWAGHFGEPADRLTELRDVPYASGAAMAIRAALFRELGGFAEELFLYDEDLELSWRVRLRGLRIVLTPRADVLHDYEFARNPQKRYLLERNRLIFLLSAFSGRLLLLVSPVLVTTELGMVALAAREGWLREKTAGWRWCARNVGSIRRRRRATQALRRVPDRELARHLTPVVDPGMIDVPALARIANPLLSLYWSLVRRAL
ncbi:MAG: glycosyltransferase family 2 protein, partial [Gaiellaceae bacterium]